MGTLLAFPIGVTSRFLQHVIPTHPRPFYDPALGFQAPRIGGEPALNTWFSFPSDHVTVFAALVVVICISRPKLSWIVIPCFVGVELARTYMGAHYPSDLMGGAGLGAMVTFAAQAPWVTKFGCRIVRWESLSPSLFYMIAFIVSFEIATLFWDVRSIADGLVHLHSSDAVGR